MIWAFRRGLPVPRRVPDGRLMSGQSRLRYQHVPRVLPLPDGEYPQPVGNVRPDIFGAVDREVDLAVQKGALNVLDECASSQVR